MIIFFDSNSEMFILFAFIPVEKHIKFSNKFWISQGMQISIFYCSGKKMLTNAFHV